MNDRLEKRIERLEQMTSVPRSSLERLLNDNEIEVISPKRKFRVRGSWALIVVFFVGMAAPTAANSLAGYMRGTIDFLDKPLVLENPNNGQKNGSLS